MFQSCHYSTALASADPIRLDDACVRYSSVYTHTHTQTQTSREADNQPIINVLCVQRYGDWIELQTEQNCTILVNLS